MRITAHPELKTHVRCHCDECTNMLSLKARVTPPHYEEFAKSEFVARKLQQAGWCVARRKVKCKTCAHGYTETSIDAADRA